MAKAKWPVYGEITGPLIMIGFGSIGRGTLPLIERHFKFDESAPYFVPYMHNYTGPGFETLDEAKAHVEIVWKLKR